MKNNNVIWIIVVVIVIGIVFLLASGNSSENTEPMQDNVVQDDSMMEDEVMTESEMEDEIVRQDVNPEFADLMGVYEDYSPEKLALANDGKVVLFFHAPWCPTCRGLDKDISKNLSSIPPNIAILKTNYDDETALKQKYGVTYQHTMIQVDADGNMIARWSGSPTLASVLQAIK